METHPPVQLSISTKAQHGAATMQNAPGLGLTPPVTPTIDDNVSELGTSFLSSGSSNNILSPVVAETRLGIKTVAVSSPPHFLDELEYLHDEKGRRIKYGSGAWSDVYMAEVSPRTSHSTRPITPPSSPKPSSRVVAVKSPGRRDARAVLHAEALALTRASSVPDSELYIVPFHGYISDSGSIVMSAIPYALSTHIEEKAVFARENLSTRTMLDPVQGMSQWHDLAKKLIAALSWLHSSAQIVHGDIKPHNILLRPSGSLENADSSEFSYEPLFADFSSSHPISASEKPTGTALSAVTPPYTAPELLRSLSLPDTVLTPDSDVFSLAATLLAAAIGDLHIYSGFNATQRLLRAKEGHRVIEFARDGDCGARVPRNGTVEKILRPAVAKDPVERIAPSAWLSLVWGAI
ncbi:kinase-like domain-containing protein [Aspergillus crustosus]